MILRYIFEHHYSWPASPDNIYQNQNIARSRFQNRTWRLFPKTASVIIFVFWGYFIKYLDNNEYSEEAQQDLTNILFICLIYESHSWINDNMPHFPCGQESEWKWYTKICKEWQNSVKKIIRWIDARQELEWSAPWSMCVTCQLFN